MVGLVDEYDRKTWNNGQDAMIRKLAALTKRLISDSRGDDVPKIILDSEYRDQMFSHYFPDGNVSE